MAKYNGMGWHNQSIRHSNARKYGHAGGKYKTYAVTYNMGFLTYEVKAKSPEEAQEIALKKRLEEGYQSPTSELEEIKEVGD